MSSRDSKNRVVNPKNVLFTEEGRPYRMYRDVRDGVRRGYLHRVTCDVCGVEFYPKKLKTNLCSMKCVGKSKVGKPQNKVKARTLDYIVGKRVRSRGECESGRAEHAGGLQWAHGFSRRYLHVRWDLRNGFCLCKGCHFYFTNRPLEWDEWLRGKWGQDLYDQIRATALTRGPVDKESVWDTLKQGK